MNNSRVIKGGRVLDPANNRDETADIYIVDGVISAVPPESKNAEMIDAKGLTVTPGLIDIHVHFREPGGEDAETIASGLHAAAAGGFTTVVTMPNTTPPTDTPDRISYILKQGEKAGMVTIMPSGCITAGRAGTGLADLAAMKQAGAVAFTDDGTTVANDDIMREAMRIAAELNVPILDHAQDPALFEAGRAREAEIRTVERDIGLARETGCAVHIQHVSTAEAAELIRAARNEGLRVSGEATPHHLALTVDDMPADDANFKMNPPLETAEDREALIAGTADGTLHALATDHAPHSEEKKRLGMDKAPFGVIGLETAVGATYTQLVKSGRMSPEEWLARWTTGPANILGIPVPSLSTGVPANAAVLDLETEWEVVPADFRSKSRNTPFIGKTLTGRAVYTILNGTIIHRP